MNKRSNSMADLALEKLNQHGFLWEQTPIVINLTSIIGGR